MTMARPGFGAGADGFFDCMKTTNVILFQSRERLQQKARTYIEDPQRLLEERGQAVPLLLQALKLGDPDLKREIMLLLGGFAGPDVIWPLFRLLTDPNEDEEVRHDAAIQLSVTASFLSAPQDLIEQLLAALKSTDPVTRAGAAFALGWRGNAAAAIALIDCLYDPDPQVQQAAVNALSNLEDDRILGLLIDRLHHAALEQRRGILYNLWRFADQRPIVAEEYRRILACATDELRADALILLGMIGGIEHQRPAFRRLFKDPDARIRELAFKELAGLTPRELGEFKTDIEAGLADPEPRVKRAVLKAFRKMPPP
ncbi:MAG: HEAT repeat domain-containing protein [Desulfobacterales bacterium]